MERLQKVMAKAGVASRRKSEELITAGRVKVNGKVVTELGSKVDPSQDQIEVDGKRIQEENLVYILLNKPQGYVTTADDPHGRRTVLDLIKVKQRVYPVGRLDYDTEGLLLLTNDGDVTYALTHPSHQITKKYIATVEGVPNQGNLKALERGIKLADGWTAPAKVEVVVDFNDKAILSLEIHEGRKHQVKRMCKAVGHPVQELKRIKMGPLELDDDLKLGEYRYLRKNEVKQLRDIAQKVKGNE
ncbi:rRNA pseudouridine synthase [Natroniella sulfidigena]|uniref:pseudouridine synthase n=1 Tax=Natroniella sulfidigena TaxID=723921 RepID=UPI00200B4C62|nr:pseudouridine synthase [Natroniella sulfidigena]MCK8816568.1 rRNA pseudouridine synthase [Natroniella sulfidigena]